MPTGQTFINQEVHLDDQEFRHCRFQDCTMIFSGGGGAVISDCRFDGDVGWAFRGAASRTVHFLRALYHGMGERGPEMVESVFEEIRTPFSEEEREGEA